MAQACERDQTRRTDDEWERILTKLSAISGSYTGGSFQCRHFVEAVLWVLRVGGQWRSLPRDRGNWNSDDADAFLRGIKERGIKAVIPPKANRKEPRDCYGGHYKERHAVECMFGTLNILRGPGRSYGA